MARVDKCFFISAADCLAAASGKTRGSTQYSYGLKGGSLGVSI